MRKNGPAEFWKKVRKTPSCWIWTSRKNAGGYGIFYVNGRGMPAHRYSYELVAGPIPDGLHLDHLCRNRCCVNPAHLEPVTCAINVHRGFGPAALNALAEHCPQGHQYDEANTYHYKGRRYCRACLRARASEREKKTKRWLKRVQEQRDRRERKRNETLLPRRD
jgi:hypothetical protein